MQSAKKEAEAMIRALPDDASFEDIQYRLYVLEKIRKGIESAEKGGGVPHEQARERLAGWLDD